MKRLVLFVLFMVFAGALLEAQVYRTPSNPQRQRVKPQQNAAPANKFFFGGGMGLSFGNFTRIAVQPLIGYRVSNRFSAGTRLNYEYIRDRRLDYTFNSYGGGLFGRFQVTNNIYAHAEPAYYRNKFTDDFTGSSNTNWVPFLFLGGGFIQPVGGSSAFFVEALFDVLQDANSPYRSWQPIISMGVTAGF